MDWIYGLVGGVLIGCAGAFLLLGNGSVMGASGLVFGMLSTRRLQTFFSKTENTPKTLT